VSARNWGAASEVVLTGVNLILYGTTETAVRIERVLHGARDIDSLFSGLPDSPQS